MMKNFSYRPGIGALIFDEAERFLLVEMNDASTQRFDFVKGGMHEGEAKEETLQREIREEIGGEIQYQIMGKSNWFVIYDWKPEKQREKGFLGQARVSFWVKYLGGEVIPDGEEIRSYKWVNLHELQKELLNAGFPKFVVETLVREWEERKGEMLLKNNH